MMSRNFCFISAEWVCVMEMDWFEMTLRLCNNAQCEGDYQKVELAAADAHQFECLSTSSFLHPSFPHLFIFISLSPPIPLSPHPSLPLPSLPLSLSPSVPPSSLSLPLSPLPLPLPHIFPSSLLAVFSPP